MEVAKLMASKGPNEKLEATANREEQSSGPCDGFGSAFGESGSGSTASYECWGEGYKLLNTSSHKCIKYAGVLDSSDAEDKCFDADGWVLEMKYDEDIGAFYKMLAAGNGLVEKSVRRYLCRLSNFQVTLILYHRAS